MGLRGLPTSASTQTRMQHSLRSAAYLRVAQKTDITEQDISLVRNSAEDLNEVDGPPRSRRIRAEADGAARIRTPVGRILS